MQQDARKYDAITVALHWTIGIGIIALASTELLRHEFPRGHFIREGLKAVHQPAGTILFVLILIRFAWRTTCAKVPASAQSGIGHMAAKIVHLAMYALMIAIPLAGLLYIFGSGKSIDFGLFAVSLPLEAFVGGSAKSMRAIHETLGIAILALAGLHAAAALAHHYLLRDGLMSRMTFPGKKRSRTTEPGHPTAGAVAT